VYAAPNKKIEEALAKERKMELAKILYIESNFSVG
jgi:hypothetical protein